MKKIELTFAAEQTIMNWEKQFKKKIGRTRELPEGSFIDIEEATNLADVPEDLSFSFSSDTAFKDARRQIIDTFWSLYRKHPNQPAPYDKFELSTPTVPYISDERRTLEELGFRSGDLVILGWVRLPLAMAVGRVHPRSLYNNLDDFFQAVIKNHMDSYELGLWDGKTSPSPVGAVALYTEEDIDLAQYVRQYYASLHIMSGFDLTLYFFEYFPPIGERQDVRTFWAESLPVKWYRVWSALGLMKSKPYPAESIYRIANDINIAAEQIPCLVFFHDWRKIREERFALNITSPIPQFFRKVCTDVHRAIETTKTSHKRDNIFKRVFRGTYYYFSFDEFRRNLPSWWKASEKEQDMRNVRVQSRPRDIPTVFLCHSSSDKPFVEELALDLRKLGLGVWFDKWEIRVGDLIIDKIEEGLGDNDYLAIILSPDAVNSPWVKRELNAATMMELEERRVIVLPILYQKCDIPLLIRDKLYADFTISYEDGLRSLVARLFPDAVESLDIIKAIKTS
jgi:hypothetical protein